MKTKHVFALAICTISTCTAKADWPLDTNTWDALTPFCDSQMTVTNGSAFFKDHGILLSRPSFPRATEITGSFAFVGNSYDQFRINLRCDGHLQDPAKNFALGTYIYFGGSDAPLNTPNNIGVEDDIGGVYSKTSFTLATNTFYNFRITDTGKVITLYFNDQPTPFLSLSTTNREGGVTNKIGLDNNRGNCGGDPISDGAAILLKSFIVKDLIPLRVYTAIELEFFAQTGSVYQVQASPDLATWTNLGPQIQGSDTFWNNTYSTRGQSKLFYRVDLVP